MYVYVHDVHVHIIGYKATASARSYRTVLNEPPTRFCWSGCDELTTSGVGSELAALVLRGSKQVMSSEKL